MQKGKAILAAMTIAAVGSASADISLNFVENASNQNFAGGENIGALNSDSSYWNQNNAPTTGDFATGTLDNLIDGTGANSGASVAWTTGGTWYNSDGTADDQHKLNTGYLDDTVTSDPFGVRITLANIPYAEYRVYGLVGSDQATLGVRNAQVNGAWVSGDGSADIGNGYGTVEGNFAANGSYWTEIVSGSVDGNYWVSGPTSGSSLTIDVLGRYANGSPGASRGAITGIIIEQIPEPATLGMVAVFGGGILLIRRKFMI